MGSLSHTILSLLNALNIPFAAFLSDWQPPLRLPPSAVTLPPPLFSIPLGVCP